MEDHRILAKTVLSALIPGSSLDGASLDDAIRLELLLAALEDRERPRTLVDLLRVLERISTGEVAEHLIVALRDRAEDEPSVWIRDLAR